MAYFATRWKSWGDALDIEETQVSTAKRRDGSCAKSIVPVNCSDNCDGVLLIFKFNVRQFNRKGLNQRWIVMNSFGVINSLTNFLHFGKRISRELVNHGNSFWRESGSPNSIDSYGYSHWSPVNTYVLQHGRFGANQLLPHQFGLLLRRLSGALSSFSLGFDLGVGFIHSAPLTDSDTGIDSGGTESGRSPISENFLFTKILSVAAFLGAICFYALTVRYLNTHDCGSYGFLVIMLGFTVVSIGTIALLYSLAQ